MNYLADVNLWLASIVEKHPHHFAARSWWNEQVIARQARVFFCRMTQLGLLRLLSNERVMGPQRQTHTEAWSGYQQLRSQAPVCYREEAPGLEAVLCRYCRSDRSSTGFWTDAYLAAFAQTAGLKLATFDDDFRRFPGLDVAFLRV